MTATSTSRAKMTLLTLLPDMMGEVHAMRTRVSAHQTILSTIRLKRGDASRCLRKRIHADVAAVCA